MSRVISENESLNGRGEQRASKKASRYENEHQSFQIFRLPKLVFQPGVPESGTSRDGTRGNSFEQHTG